MPDDDADVQVEWKRGHWKTWGEMSVRQAAMATALSTLKLRLMEEMAGLMTRWLAAVEADPMRYRDALPAPGEVLQVIGSPAEAMPYLQVQGALDAMRAHMTEMGLEAEPRGDS